MLHKISHSFFRILLMIGVLVFVNTAVHAQPNRNAKATKAPPKTTAPKSDAAKIIAAPKTAEPKSSAFTLASTQAKQTGKPLIVLGMAEGCHRCAHLKEGIKTEPEIKLLMTQYVSVEIPFGASEFKDVFHEIVRKDEKFNKPIGGPSVFIFTAKGDTVYAGPNTPNGMQPDNTFKELLIDGIKQNGGLRSSTKSATSNLASDVAKAQKLLKDNQTHAAAGIISQYVSTAADKSSEKSGATDEMESLIKLTNLNVYKSKSDEQLDSLVQELSEKGLSLIQAVSTAVGSGDATLSAVKLAALDRAFGKFPMLTDKIDVAWKELLEKANIPNLKEHAKLIDNARQAELGPDSAPAIAAYELVNTTYPGTKAAEFSQQRIAQLRAKKLAAVRVWKSKNGQSSVTATLVSFDGKSAELLTDKGKTVTVALEGLSDEDQQYLKTNKTK